MAERRLSLRPAHLDTLRRLLREYLPDAEVWAYGSRTDDTAYDGSDLDLVVRNPRDLSVPQPAEFWKLEAALRESALPFLVELHDWARLPGAFRRTIERGHVVVQAAAPESSAGATAPPAR